MAPKKKSAKSKLKRVGRVGRQVRDFNRAIGEKIAELSEQRGGNTITLAKAIGLSQAQVSRLQNGLQGYRSGTLLKIAKALDVNPRDLLPR